MMRTHHRLVQHCQWLTTARARVLGLSNVLGSARTAVVRTLLSRSQRGTSQRWPWPPGSAGLPAGAAASYSVGQEKPNPADCCPIPYSRCIVCDCSTPWVTSRDAYLSCGWGGVSPMRNAASVGSPLVGCAAAMIPITHEMQGGGGPAVA